MISVWDKTGIVDFARVLTSFGVEILSTGGTAETLKRAGLAVREVSDYTGFPEMLDGRVKTLHPKIHAALLALRENAEHLKIVAEHHIGLIDMVVVNLYPFEEVIQKENILLEEAVEHIDIGGPAMLRSAAKNYRFVAVVSDPRFYGCLTQELKDRNGALARETLEALCIEAFRRTSVYDDAIARFLAMSLTGAGKHPLSFPDILAVKLKKALVLRYGENPHQRAALYSDASPGASLASGIKLQGKELSFNNYLDMNVAYEIVREFDAPCVAIVKHANPTGVAQDKDLKNAYRRAHETDKLSAFGGIIGCNRRVDGQTARAVLESGFMECVVAPGYTAEALRFFKAKKNLRLLEVFFKRRGNRGQLDFKNIDGGLLVQEKDEDDAGLKDWKVVTKKKSAKSDSTALLFGWKVVKHVKSNAIVLARGTRTVGIGMGETSRVDAVFMALRRAGERSRGAVMASDAFFPKEDSIMLAGEAGVRAIIQPGGSIADADVIRAADRAGIAMVFTGTRHFKH